MLKLKGPKPIPAELRFWQKVHRDPIGCWEWRASRFPNGYGSAYVSGRGKSVIKGLAHRIAYRFANGLIPPGMLVCHSCDNKSCVRPSHLWLGTSSDNTQDMLDKGRNVPPRGERSGRAKLEDRDVLRIRELVLAGTSRADLAVLYSVHKETIRKIVSRERWKHI